MPELLNSISGRFWRSTFIGNESKIFEPASAPNGRWHHDGQRALYLSASPEGCRIALKVYQNSDDPDRGIFRVRVENAKIADLRRPEIRRALRTTLPEVHAFWADLMANGQTSPTWAISDALRKMGADRLLTPSRSRPDLTHLTLFNWNNTGGPSLARCGEPLSH